MARRQRIAILGGGPGGYEAALVAAQLGAEVTLVERDGLGGAAVRTDCVPSKALVATAGAMGQIHSAATLGVHAVQPDFSAADMNQRIMALALAQSHDVRLGLERAGVRIILGEGRLQGPQRLVVRTAVGTGQERTEELTADVVLLATGARPRTLPGSVPDGERILTWTQLYGLRELPAHLVVVGSGVTGAEFACAYLALGSRVTLVSSRDRVLPTEDEDAALVVEKVFRRGGGVVKPRSRALAVQRTGDGVVVQLADGGEVSGSHALVAIGAVPNTDGLGLAEAGVRLDDRGFVEADRVSRTAAANVYAAGDCTGVLMLASVAAMQGRIAMWHALGETVAPLDLGVVASTVFTQPEIATVGDGSGQECVQLPLATNARAKMEVIEDGFIKLFARAGTVVGGVVCSPHASELIHPITIAVAERLTVDRLAQIFTVYPSLSGSIAEAARRLHSRSHYPGMPR